VCVCKSGGYVYVLAEAHACACVRGVCLESAVGVCARVYIHTNLKIQIVAVACVSVRV
jgi:hypothetical protein